MYVYIVIVHIECEHFSLILLEYSEKMKKIKSRQWWKQIGFVIYEIWFCLDFVYTQYKQLLKLLDNDKTEKNKFILDISKRPLR